MIGIEVTRDGHIWLLEDRSTVIRMVRIGQLGPADTVRESRDAAWADASSLDWLASAFQGDPWEAWEELDGVDPEQVWAEAAVPVEADIDPVDDTDVSTREAMTREAEPEPLIETLSDADVEPSEMSLSFQPAPALSEPVVSPSPADPSPASQPPQDPVGDPPALAASAEGSPVSSMGQVIEFPNGRQGAARSVSDVSAALLQPLEVQDLVPNDLDSVRVHEAPPPQPPRSLAPWLVVMALILCLAAFGLSLWSIQRDAQWTSARATAVPPTPQVQASEVAEVPEAVEEVASPEASASASASEEEAEQVSQLARLDAELRERIPPSPLDLRGGPDDLESALLIELSNMKLGPVKVSAPVVSWTGARNDVVEVADVEVRLTSSGSIERELAAVGLVLGKYLQHYGFEVRTFSVIVIGQDGISRKRQMEPVSARHLWSGRKDLYEFLTGR